MPNLIVCSFNFHSFNDLKLYFRSFSNVKTVYGSDIQAVDGIDLMIVCGSSNFNSLIKLFENDNSISYVIADNLDLKKFGFKCSNGFIHEKESGILKLEGISPAKIIKIIPQPFEYKKLDSFEYELNDFSFDEAVVNGKKIACIGPICLRTFRSFDVCDESDTHSFICRKLSKEFDALFIKAFDVETTIDDAVIALLNDYDVVLFKKKIGLTNAVLAAAVKSDVFKNGFKFRSDLSFLHLNDLSAFSHAILFCDSDIDENEMYSYLYEEEMNEISNVMPTINSKVVYSFSNSIKELPFIQKIDSSFDYVCFTNSINEDAHPWKMFKSDFSEDFVKVNAFRLLQKYDASIWVDNKIKMKRNFGDIMESLGKEHILIPSNYTNCCAYDICMQNTRLVRELVLNEYPKNNGLVDDSLIVRRHNDEACKKEMKLLWNEMTSFNSSFNQTFNFSYWKNGGRFLQLNYAILKAAYLL